MRKTEAGKVTPKTKFITRPSIKVKARVIIFKLF